MDRNWRVSTGSNGLDEVIDSLRMGDNVVLKVDNILHYKEFVTPFVARSLAEQRRVVYMRFAEHEPLITDETVVTYSINAGDGFESFSTEVHRIIADEGSGVFYVFDCLSDLLYTWATDLMIGNFFVITCPYLFELNTIAYFAIYRNANSYETINAIRNTTQVLIDIYKVDGLTYIHPLKVWNRYSPTMFIPHAEAGDMFVPLTSSSDTSHLFVDMTSNIFDSSRRHLDYWDRMFLDASDLYDKIKNAELPAQEQEPWVEKLCRNMFSRDTRFLEILTKAFNLQDLLQIKTRLIGSGFIGGKSVGMLLARKILLQNEEFKFSRLLEPHDSFYIGSDVFYTFLVQNNLWKLLMEQRQPDNYFSSAVEIRRQILQGVFPESIKNQFLRMLEYYGQAPIIVRSSSLLEDSFGNAFAGKYESIFCINQGTLDERYAQFEKAVREIYASTMNEDALTYRKLRGLADQDEQMALLVQRVSGAYRQQYFFPDVAGVGFSYNTYVWDQGIDPKAGMLRLVAGLGTRAVDRISGDYAKIVALDQPLLKPYTGLDDYRKFTQLKVDLINIRENAMQTVPIRMLLDSNVDMKLPIIADRDFEAERKMREFGLEQKESWVMTFDPLLSNSSFPLIMRSLLQALEKAYQYPVDIEFTVNFKDAAHYSVNVLQCRPLQVKGLKSKVEFPESVDPSRLFFQGSNSFMGGNIQCDIDRIILVEPEQYHLLSESDKYKVARTIGKLNSLNAELGKTVMLLGPGRWGTSTPSLGVPVMFSEINNTTVLCEVAYLKAGYAPEVSFGTHFFQDLVECEIFYVALFPERDGVVFQKDLCASYYVNQLPNLVPAYSALQHVLKVYDIGQEQHKLEIIADAGAQKIICYFSA